jgi:hypothetical protein
MRVSRPVADHRPFIGNGDPLPVAGHGLGTVTALAWPCRRSAKLWAVASGQGRLGRDNTAPLATGSGERPTLREATDALVVVGATPYATTWTHRYRGHTGRQRVVAPDAFGASEYGGCREGATVHVGQWRCSRRTRVGDRCALSRYRAWGRRSGVSVDVIGRSLSRFGFAAHTRHAVFAHIFV